MITTLTLNPAIDKTFLLENFVVNSVNRVKDFHVDAGGKGINASKVIKALGEDTIALGFVGGATGHELVTILDAIGIPHDFVNIAGNTRTNLKIVDVLNNTCTDVNESGPFVAPQQLQELYQKIEQHALDSDFLILSGNAQANLPPTIYKDIIEGLPHSNVKVILDACDDLLAEGIKARPWMIKPNIVELSEWLGKTKLSISEVVMECRNLIQTGIQYICVSMGSDGLLLVSADEAILATHPRIVAKSTVGAGDSVVGSLAVSFLQQDGLEEALRKACAIGTASVTLDSTDVPDLQTIAEFYKRVSIRSVLE